MRLACLHTHTDFCDGADTVDAMCRAAFDSGLSAIGFSAHAPLPFRTAWHLSADRLEEYAHAVRTAAAEWKGRLPVYLGLELDYIEGIAGPAEGRFESIGLDYSIGSVHYLVPENGAEPFTVDGPYEEWARGVEEGYGGDGEAAAEAYWRAVGRMAKAGGFDFVGHLDLVKKNNGAGGRPRSFDPDGPRYRSAALEALEEIRKAGTVVEVNTGALNRGSLSETYPSIELLEEARGRGIRVVVNADAHRAAHVAGHYEEARRALRAAGYEFAVLFNGSGWEPEKID